MLWKDLLLVLFPDYCLGCDCVLLSSEPYLCLDCFLKLREMEAFDTVTNDFNKRFLDCDILKEMTSLLYFEKGALSQKLIHELKYNGRQDIGEWLGDQLGKKMKERGDFSHIDVVIPVPLHRKRKKQRGYNQVTLFGKKIAEHLGVPYYEDILVRCKSGSSQTQKDKEKRFFSVKNSFLLKNTTIFASKNILIVDDVVTTGSTLRACIEALEVSDLKSINIATITYVMDDNALV